MSIVLLAILAVMWAAFLLAVIAPRRRPVLLGLTLAAASSIQVAELLGGRWWVAGLVAGVPLSAYVAALVVQGFRRNRRNRPAPRPRHRATAVVVPPVPR